MNITRSTMYQTLRKAGSTREDAMIDCVEVIAEELEGRILLVRDTQERKRQGEQVDDELGSAIYMLVQAWERAREAGK